MNLTTIGTGILAFMILDGVWLGRNVFGRPTERERVCEQPDRHGALREVRRALFVRLP